MFGQTSVWAGIISGGVSQLENTRSLSRGEIDSRQYAVHTTKNVTGAFGLMAGIEYGAVLGSAVMPGIGTIAGSILGAMVGDRVGRYLGFQSGNMLFKTQVMNRLSDSMINPMENLEK